MRMKILSSLLLMALAIVSCQKEPNNDPPSNPGNGSNNNNNNPPTNDSIYLAKYVELDTTLPAGQDTTIIYTFSYDGFKRIKNVRILDYYSPAYTYDYNIDYYYQSDNDAHPYKIVEVETEPAITYSDTHYFTYSNGFVASDSSILYRVTNNELLDKYVALYIDSGDQTFIQTKDSVFSPNHFYTHAGTIFKTYQNENIVAQVDTSTTGNTLTNAARYQITYDSKINPFFKIDVPYPVYDDANLSFETGKNNMTERSAFDNNSSVFDHKQYQYSYRADNYPLKVRIIDMIDPTESRTGFFFYTK